MNNRIIKAPNEVILNDGQRSLFLIGSIEMGKAYDWQAALSDMILNNQELDNIVITSPRREHWDNSWEQKITHDKFNEQVTWELDNIEDADYCVIYFDKNTNSPITLLELGLVSQIKPDKCFTICPEGYFRKGNVDIVCNRYGIQQGNSFEDFIAWLEYKINYDNEDKVVSLNDLFNCGNSLTHI